MTEIAREAGATAREIAAAIEKLGDFLAEHERLAFKETLHHVRNRVRRANLPPMTKLLFYEQTFLAEDRGDFRADHKTADIAKATGMSERSVRRHQQHLSDAKFVRMTNDGRGAGGTKGIELSIPDDTVVELSHRLEAKPAT